MNRLVKRVFDISLSLVGLLVLFPLFVAIAIAIKLDSPGPVFFRQERVGWEARRFRIYKFRSMRVTDPGDHANYSPTNDARITRVGSLLRASFVDELPQLINVLRGDMSLVGPRPETPEFVALYSEVERRVLMMKPGMTGPSAIAFWNEGDILAAHDDPDAFYKGWVLPERIRMDMTYQDRASLLFDLSMLFRTASVIVTRGRLLGQDASSTSTTSPA